MKKLVINTANGTIEIALPKEQKGVARYAVASGHLVVGDRKFPLAQIDSWQETSSTAPGGPNRFERAVAEAEAALGTLLEQHKVEVHAAEAIVAAARAAALARRRLAAHPAKPRTSPAPAAPAVATEPQAPVPDLPLGSPEEAAALVAAAPPAKPPAPKPAPKKKKHQK